MSQKARWWWALVLTGCTTQPTALVIAPANSSETVRIERDDSTVSTSTSTTLAIDSRTAPTRQDVLELIDERVQCGRYPERCDFERLGVPGSPYDRELRALMSERIDFGLRTIAGKGAFRPTVTSIRETAPGVAEVTTCVYDALVVYDTETIPDVHIVFNDRAISIFSTWSMHFHEGRWKWFSETVTRYAIERDAC
jgi:hypothetical protein